MSPGILGPFPGEMCLANICEFAVNPKKKKVRTTCGSFLGVIATVICFTNKTLQNDLP